MRIFGLSLAAALGVAIVAATPSMASIPQPVPAASPSRAFAGLSSSDKIASRTTMPITTGEIVAFNQSLRTATMLGEPSKVAMVDSCSDSWWGRSMIEEITCGLIGGGWFN